MLGCSLSEAINNVDYSSAQQLYNVMAIGSKGECCYQRYYYFIIIVWTGHQSHTLHCSLPLLWTQYHYKYQSRTFSLHLNSMKNKKYYLDADTFSNVRHHHSIWIFYETGGIKKRLFLNANAVDINERILHWISQSRQRNHSLLFCNVYVSLNRHRWNAEKLAISWVV